MRTFDWFCWNFSEHSGHAQGDKASYPARPDNSAWTLTGYETIDWKEPAFVGEHGCFSYDKNEVKQEIDFGQFKFYAGNFYKKTPEYLTYAEAYTLWLMCTGRTEDCEDGHVRKLLEYGYLKTSNGVVEPNVVIFDRAAQETYNAETAARLSVLNEEIGALIAQASSISRGYVVEQALEDGWLRYDEHTINTVGAFIYL